MISILKILNESNPCWKGYKQIGMKQKGKREVPNCVPIKENSPAYKGPEGYDDSCDCYPEDINELEINNPVDIKKELLNYLNKAILQLEKYFKNKEYWVIHSYIWIVKSLKVAITEIEMDSRFDSINEAKYQGRTVQLNKPMQGDTKKFKVYVKNPKTGKIVKVNFGAKGMNIKKNNPKNKKAYCSRSKGIKGGGKDKTKANYWSRKMWNCK